MATKCSRGVDVLSLKKSLVTLALHQFSHPLPNRQQYAGKNRTRDDKIIEEKRVMYVLPTSKLILVQVNGLAREVVNVQDCQGS